MRGIMPRHRRGQSFTGGANRATIAFVRHSPKAAGLKILILGAGQVGSSVAESLVSEANDITIVDTDHRARLKYLQDRLDLRTVVGNAAHPAVLTEAGANDADMIFAVTRSDETNLVACKLAATL